MATASVFEHFVTLKDPRLDRRKLHQLPDILFMTLCAVISGCDNWVHIADYCEIHKDWFTEVLKLEHGIPSHDTFNNVFKAIDNKEFNRCFCSWARDLSSLTNGDIIAIDGKCLRGSIDSASEKSAIYMVNAWSTQNELVLAQHQVSDKSNEITAIPKLLELLNIHGAVFTIDAMGCQTEIADLTIEKGGDYLIALKGNQKTLFEDVKHYFESPLTAPNTSYTTIDGDHGRIEKRTIRSTNDVAWLRERHPNWQSIHSIIEVVSQRDDNDKGIRYFVSSLKEVSDLKKLATIVRGHWGIENKLHWVLDMAFDEDRQRQREDESPANLSVLRQIALNMLKADTTTKMGIKGKRLKAGWSLEYLMKIVFGQKMTLEQISQKVK